METLEQQLQRQEATRYSPYDDATGYPLRIGYTIKGNVTIGIGWNLSGVPLPQSVVDLMFTISLQKVDDDLELHLSWVFTLDDIRRDVFRNLCFNMGINKLLGFPHMLAAAQAGDWDEASNELKNSEWYTEVGERGVELVAQLKAGIRQR